MVPGAGLEPARPYDRGILNPLCLPISPPGQGVKWRRVPESNRGGRICNPLHGHSANAPLNLMCIPLLKQSAESGAGNETRTRDPDLGKVVLYQLSYSRIMLLLSNLLILLSF